MHFSQIKKSAAFNKSYQELLLHQKLLADPVELTKLFMKSKKKITKPANLNVRISSKPVNKRSKRKHDSFDVVNKDIYDFNESSVPTSSYSLKNLPRKLSPSMYKIKGYLCKQAMEILTSTKQVTFDEIFCFQLIHIFKLSFVVFCTSPWYKCHIVETKKMICYLTLNLS